MQTRSIGFSAGPIEGALALLFLISFPCHYLAAQTTTSKLQPSAEPAALPLPLQIKKTVAFFETDCLHDFVTDVRSVTPEILEQMPVAQRLAIEGQLTQVTVQLQRLKPSLSKLTPDQIARLQAPPSVDAGNVIPDILWRLQIASKMAALTPEDLASLKPEQLDLLPRDPYWGTGFFVGLADPRLKIPTGATGPSSFTYLITNHHVAEPGVEFGRPCQVLKTSLIVNRRPDSAHLDPYAETISLGRIVPWTFPEDKSVDLAVVPVNLSREQYDYLVIPNTQFITDDDVSKHVLVEGDPVIFSGLFIQSFSEVHTLEPIVRSGTLALIPEGPLETTIQQRPGKLYLAEAHAFGGNSGSPMFVDTNRFANIIAGPSYRFLGVISGEVLENSDLTVTVTTFLAGKIGANSDVSMVVPAAEVLKLLNSRSLQAERDAYVASQSNVPSAASQ